MSDDSDACARPQQAILQALGFSARVEARAERTDAGFDVILVMTSWGNKAETFRGQGVTLKTRRGFQRAPGQGTLLLELTPADASFRVDGQPYGQGSGRYIVGAGQHVILVEAPKYRLLEETIEVAQRRPPNSPFD